MQSIALSSFSFCLMQLAFVFLHDCSVRVGRILLKGDNICLLQNLSDRMGAPALEAAAALAAQAEGAPTEGNADA
jgi:hypothetical protein